MSRDTVLNGVDYTLHINIGYLTKFRRRHFSHKINTEIKTWNSKWMDLDE